MRGRKIEVERNTGKERQRKTGGENERKKVEQKKSSPPLVQIIRF